MQQPEPVHESMALLRTLYGHNIMVMDCAISPDDTWIVSAGWDGQLKMWDTETGTELHTLSGHTDAVTACAISPDGKWIVSASADKTLKLWDANTGIEMRTLIGHTDSVAGCAVGPNGTWIASSSIDGTVKVWESTTGIEQLTIAGQNKPLLNCAISPDSKWIVWTSTDRTLKIWDVAAGTEHKVIECTSPWCAVSLDSRYVFASVIVDMNMYVKAWDIATGEEQVIINQGYESGYARSGFVSPDGRWMVVGLGDGSLKIYDVVTGKPRYTFVGHTNQITGCAVSHNGKKIVSASFDFTLKIWDATAESDQPPQSASVDDEAITACVVSPDGQFMVSTAAETLKVRDPISGSVRKTLAGHQAEVSDCVVSSDSRFIASASDDQTVKIWDAASGTERLTFKGHVKGINACAAIDYSFGASFIDPHIIASASDDGTVRVWETEIIRTSEGHALAGHNAPVNDCAIDQMGQWLVSASDDSTLKVWDLDTGIERLTFSGHTAPVNACSIYGNWVVV
jgi:WD40 repeat protein